MKRKIFIGLVLSIGIAFGLFFWLRFSENTENTVSNIPSQKSLSEEARENLANINIEDFKTLSYKKDLLTWKLVSKKAAVYEEKNLTKVLSVDLIFFNEDQEPTSFVLTDEAVIENDTRNITMKKNVRIKNTKGTSIKGQLFYWNNNLEQLSSEKEVELTKSNGFKIVGTGFSTDKNLESIHFDSQVSGTLNAESDLEEDFFNVEFDK